MCGVDEAEKSVLQKTLKRSELLAFFANQPAALAAMESGSGAHHWARSLRELGHSSKHGDSYLRTLLVHGARSELRYTPTREDRKSRWGEKGTLPLFVIMRRMLAKLWPCHFARNNRLYVAMGSRVAINTPGVQL